MIDAGGGGAGGGCGLGEGGGRGGQAPVERPVERIFVQMSLVTFAAPDELSLVVVVGPVKSRS